MSSYRRFISYMYDYHHGQKRKNCGFVKIEIKNDRCVIYFQLKNAPCAEKCNVYLYCQGQEPEYVFLQEIPVRNGMINYRLETSSVHMTPQCKGLLCTDETGNDCGTCWDGDGLPEYRPMTRDTIMQKTQEVAVPTDSAVTEVAAESVKETFEGVMAEPVSEMVQTESNSTPENEAPAPDPEHESQNSKEPNENTTHTQRSRTFSELWDHMQKEFPAITPFEDNAIVETIKISPSDLGYLQANNLNLGTNQFLLHGYKSYQHLLLGRLHEQMRYVIGVPGVYDPQEQFMAKMFGFTCFKPVRECKQKNGQFGYWLRCFR